MKKALLHILFSFSFPIFSMGQGLCDSDAAVENGFSLPANVGCNPFNVKPTNLTDWTDVKYVFGYTGQDADQLPSLNPQLEDVFFTGPNGEPRSYTVLQFGKDANGEEKYSCQVVEVYSILKPLASLTTCNLTNAEIAIPLDGNEAFDEILISFNASETVSVLKSDLPKAFNRSLPLGTMVKIEGKINNHQIECVEPTFLEVGLVSSLASTNVKTLEIESGNIVKIDFEGSYAPGGYKVFMNEAESANQFTTPIDPSVQPGTVMFEVPDSTKSYCFTFTREESCGGTEVTPDYCTTPIVDLNKSLTENTIYWNPHKSTFYDIPSIPLLIGSRRVDSQIEIIHSETGSRDSTISSSDNAITHEVNCSQNVCYRIKSVIKDRFGFRNYEVTSISNLICSNAFIETPSPITDIVASHHQDNEYLISFSDNSTWGLQRERYFLYGSNIPTAIDSLDGQGSFTSIIDENCFQIGFEDVCGNISEKSPEVCTVLLSGLNDIELTWTPNNPFGLENIDSYEIYSFNEASKDFEFFTNRSNAFQNLKPDLEPFTNEAKFKVRVIGSDGGESFSNAVSLPLEFKVFLPEVVTPNNDGINDFLELKGSLLRAQDLNLLVFDRWGRLQHESSGLDSKWYPNKGLPNGNYIYRIKAKLLDGSPYEKSGVIQITR